MLSPEDFARLDETSDVLGYPWAWADLLRADAAYARADIVRGADAARPFR